MRSNPLQFDQYTALGILILAIVYAYAGSLTPIGFYNGSIGPQHWIYILALLLSILSFILWFTPTSLSFSNQISTTRDWLYRIPFITGIIIYALVLPYIGFLPAMIVLMIVVSLLFGATPIKAVIIAVLMSLLCYWFFDGLLGISLGRGDWWR